MKRSKGYRRPRPPHKRRRAPRPDSLFSPRAEGSFGTGPCGKKIYDSRGAAKRVAGLIRGYGAQEKGEGRMRAYRCKDGCPPGSWHTTSYDAEQTRVVREAEREGVRRGPDPDRTRADRRPRQQPRGEDEP